MRFRTQSGAALLVCAAAVATLAGCGGEETETPSSGLSLDASPSADPSSPAESPSASPDSGRTPKNPVDGELTRGLSAAESSQEREVADVWFEYWEELFRLFGSTKENRDTLYSLASDEAATQPLDYVAGMRERGETQGGGAIAAITSVRVDGDRAVVKGCFRDETQNVNRSGEPVEQPSLFFTTRDILIRQGPDWRVSAQAKTGEGVPCGYR